MVWETGVVYQYISGDRITSYPTDEKVIDTFDSTTLIQELVIWACKLPKRDNLPRVNFPVGGATRPLNFVPWPERFHEYRHKDETCDEMD